MQALTEGFTEGHIAADISIISGRPKLADRLSDITGKLNVLMINLDEVTEELEWLHKSPPKPNEEEDEASPRVPLLRLQKANGS